jgi:endonuclease YncB( thermonuclease family)
MWDMQGALRVALPVLALAAAIGGAAGKERLAGSFVARVTEVIDGDTLSVEVPVWLGLDLDTKVRLRGIDAPELHGRCPQEKDLAIAAKRHLARETTAQVTLTNVEGDKYYGRVEADVTTVPDGLNLSAAMLSSGLARAYDGGRRGGWCDLAGLGR